MNYLIKKFNFTKSLKKKFSHKFLFLSAQQTSIKAAKQYVYLPIDSKRENVLKLFDTSRSSRFQGGKLEDWNSVCALLFERYRGRWNGWLMTSWAVHTIRAHVSRYSPTRSVVVYTLARKFETFQLDRGETRVRYRFIPMLFLSFFSFLFFLYFFSRRRPHLDLSKSYLRPSNPPKQRIPTLACLAFALLDIWWTRARWIWELVDEQFYRK